MSNRHTVTVVQSYPGVIVVRYYPGVAVVKFYPGVIVVGYYPGVTIAQYHPGGNYEGDLEAETEPETVLRSCHSFTTVSLKVAGSIYTRHTLTLIHSLLMMIYMCYCVTHASGGVAQCYV